MKMFLIALSMVFVAGCTSSSTNPSPPVLCAVAKTITSVVAGQIATQLACKNQSAIEASLVTQLNKAVVCSSTASGAIGDLVCGPFVNSLMSGILSNQVPAAWQCSGGPLGDALKAKLLLACTAAL